jgi:riboflavin biosynthesis pyrimidine reductase
VSTCTISRPGIEDATCWSSVRLSLVEHDLLDEVRVMIDPLVVGAGKRLFGDGNPIRALRLVESQVTGTGAILATYAATK